MYSIYSCIHELNSINTAVVIQFGIFISLNLDIYFGCSICTFNLYIYAEYFL